MSQNPRRPIGYNQIGWVVLMEDGRFVDLDEWQYPNGKPLVWPDPKSKKQERAWAKTLRLAIRRVQRGGKFL